MTTLELAQKYSSWSRIGRNIAQTELRDAVDLAAGYIALHEALVEARRALDLAVKESIHDDCPSGDDNIHVQGCICNMYLGALAKIDAALGEKAAKCKTCGGNADWTGTADDGISCPDCKTETI